MIAQSWAAGSKTPYGGSHGMSGGATPHWTGGSSYSSGSKTPAYNSSSLTAASPANNSTYQGAPTPAAFDAPTPGAFGAPTPAVDQPTPRYGGSNYGSYGNYATPAASAPTPSGYPETPGPGGYPETPGPGGYPETPAAFPQTPGPWNAETPAAGDDEPRYE
jgi:transcription elongation factor SPT5